MKRLLLSAAVVLGVSVSTGLAAGIWGPGNGGPWDGTGFGEFRWDVRGAGDARPAIYLHPNLYNSALYGGPTGYGPYRDPAGLGEGHSWGPNYGTPRPMGAPFGHRGPG